MYIVVKHINSYTTNTGLELRLDSLGVFVLLSFAFSLSLSLFLTRIFNPYTTHSPLCSQSCTNWSEYLHTQQIREWSPCTRRFCEEITRTLTHTHTYKDTRRSEYKSNYK